MGTNPIRQTITPMELQCGDIYQGRRIVYVAEQGSVVYVDYEDGIVRNCVFQKNGQIEIIREIERIEL